MFWGEVTVFNPSQPPLERRGGVSSPPFFKEGLGEVRLNTEPHLTEGSGPFPWKRGGTLFLANFTEKTRKTQGTIKQVVITKSGGAEVLKVQETKDPVPGKNEDSTYFFQSEREYLSRICWSLPLVLISMMPSVSAFWYSLDTDFAGENPISKEYQKAFIEQKCSTGK